MVFFLVTTSDSNVVADATGNSESFSYQGKSQASVIAIAGSNSGSGAGIKNNAGTKSNETGFVLPPAPSA